MGFFATQRVALAGAAGLVAAMGVGRFMFTPLLPLMEDDGVLTRSGGAAVATANYAGYLVGAVALAVRPHINTSWHLRIWAVLLVASELVMAVVSDTAMFSVLRFVAGVASAVIFVGCVSTVAAARRRGASSALALSGVGGGIALSGVIAWVASPVLDWRGLWLVAGVVTAVMVIPVCLERVTPETGAVSDDSRPSDSVHTPTWRLLMASYFLEGIGYIVIGTFLVAAVSAGRSSGSSVGPLVWTVVGIAAVPTVLMWTHVAKRIGPQRTLVIALVMQTVGAILPAVSDSPAVLIVAAALFGGTFVGIVGVTMTIGASLPVARTAAILTAIYGVGQILGPVVVAPVIGSSYTTAFVVATAVLAGSVLAAVGVAATSGRRAAAAATSNC